MNAGGIANEGAIEQRPLPLGEVSVWVSLSVLGWAAVAPSMKGYKSLRTLIFKKFNDFQDALIIIFHIAKAYASANAVSDLIS